MVLPNFLLIGPPKTGSTSLYQYLKAHPEVYLSQIKEPGFFMMKGKEVGEYFSNKYYSITNLADYQALFEDVENEGAIGEASTRYIYSTYAAKNIAEIIPGAKLIAVLRNPADRAFSEYLMMRLKDWEEDLSFEEVIARELAERPELGHYDPNRNYINGGMYHHFLQPYLKLFPREQLKFFIYDDLLADADQVMEEMFAFLGVDPGFRVDTGKKENTSGIPKSKFIDWLFRQPNPIKDTIKQIVPNNLRRNVRISVRKHNLKKPEMSAWVRAQLVEVFRPDVLQLQDLLQRDLSVWLNA